MSEINRGTTTTGTAARYARRRAAALLVCLPLVLVACGEAGQEVSTDEDPADALAAATDKSLEAGGFTVRWTTEVDPELARCYPPDLPTGFLPDEVSIETARDRERWTLDGETYYRDGDAYLLPAAAVPKTWKPTADYIRIDEADHPDAFEAAQMSTMALGSTGDDADDDLPSAMLAELQEATDDVATVGTETIDGAETTHLRAVVTEAQAEDSDNLGPGTVDLWVDEAGLVRRMRFGPPPVDPTATTEPFLGSGFGESMQIDLTDYGKPIEMPADVVDLQDLDVADPAGDLSEMPTGSVGIIGSDDWTPPEGCDDVLGPMAGMFAPECREFFKEAGDRFEETFGEIGTSIEDMEPLDGATATTFDEEWVEAAMDDLRPPDACLEAMSMDPDCYPSFDLATTTTRPPSCADDPMFGDIGFECAVASDSESVTTPTWCDEGFDELECADDGAATATTVAEASPPTTASDPCAVVDFGFDPGACSLMGAMFSGDTSELPEGCIAAMPAPCRKVTEKWLVDLATLEGVLPEAAYDSLSDCLVSLGVIESCIPPNDPDAELSDDCTDLVDDAMARDFLIDE